MRYKVLDSVGKVAAHLEVDDKEMKVLDETPLFKDVMVVVLKEGLSVFSGGKQSEKICVDNVTKVKKFNALNLGLLERYLVLLGYTLKEE